MRYVMARYESERRDMAYRIYITDALRIISENTAKLGGGGYIKARFLDIIDPTPADERTHDEVVDHIRGCLRELR